MALQIQFEDAAGVNHPEAYARVSHMIIENVPGREKNISVNVTVYASKKSRDDGKNQVWGPQGFQVQDTPIKTKVPQKAAVDPDSATVADIYAWLKTQEMFRKAKDV
jgi:hypothetical protein